jgi:hypothetical protein
MGALGMGIAGGVGQTLQKQQDDLEAGDERQRGREQQFLSSLLNSTDPKIRDMAVSGLASPIRRTGRDVFSGLPLKNPAVTGILKRISDTGATPPPGALQALTGGAGTPGGGLTQPGITPRAGDLFPQASASVPGAVPGGVQPTVPAQATQSTPSAAQPAQAITGARTPPGAPPQPSWQPAPTTQASPIMPQGAGLLGRDTPAQAPAPVQATPPPTPRASTTGGSGLMGPEEQAGLEVRKTVASHTAEVLGNLEAAGYLDQGTTDAYLAQQGFGRGTAPAAGGPPSTAVGANLPASLKSKLAFGVLPSYQNAAPGSAIPWEKLNATQQAQVQQEYPNAVGAGNAYTVEMDQNGIAPPRITPTMRSGLARPEDFDTTLTDTTAPTGNAQIDAELTRLVTGARSQIQLALGRNDYQEANRVLQQTTQSAERLRTLPIQSQQRINVTVGSDIGKKNEPQDPKLVSYWADQALMDSQNFRNMPPNTALKDAVSKELADRGIPITNLDGQSRSMAISAKDVIKMMPQVEQQAKDLDRLGLMGVVGGRWRDLVAGKIGSGELAGGNPQNAALIGKFMANAQLLASAISKAHFGVRGGVSGAEQFENLLGAGWRDLPTFTGSLDSARQWMTTYAGRLPTVAPDKAGPPPPPTTKTVSEGQIAAVAKKNNTTVQQERQRATAEGYVIR